MPKTLVQKATDESGRYEVVFMEVLHSDAREKPMMDWIRRENRQEAKEYYAKAVAKAEEEKNPLGFWRGGGANRAFQAKSPQGLETPSGASGTSHTGGGGLDT